MSKLPNVDSPWPAVAELARHRYTIPMAAKAMGVGYAHLRFVLQERTHASPEVIKGFKKLTGKHLKDFLDPWSFSKPFEPAFRNGIGADQEE